MATVVRMPEVLTGITEAAIQAWLVEPGQDVGVGTPLAEVETEKAVVEYAAESAGTVLQLLVEAGASVSIGDPIAIIGAAGESVDSVDVPDAAGPELPDAAGPESPDAAEPDAPMTAAAEASIPATGTIADPESGAPVADRDAEPAAPATVEDEPAGRAMGIGPGASPAADGGRRFASPIVRRLAREQGVDLSRIVGTGPNGRIVRRDLETQASGQAAPTRPAPSPAAPRDGAPATTAPAATPAGETEDVPITPMRRAIARRVTESTSTVPHFFLTADCRVDELLELRRRVNEASAVRISVNDFVLKACAGAFTDVPEANATWGDTVIHRHHAVDIAVAVTIEGGLVTPVVRGVERLSLSEVASTVADLAERARGGRLRQEELEGGSFSVSNLGMFGTTEFSAIINPPHAGILAIGAARKLPVVDDAGALAVGTVMTVTLSADHRVLDGALAAQWLAAFVKRIEQPLSVLI
ncbi:MAG: 2-oxo acid dehydrogenase subunit E2 [Actinomycetota bacterium]|nr:2-oxo acid dehydrogenase subunit E2 [Actinomycetota bacterium]